MILNPNTINSRGRLVYIDRKSSRKLKTDEFRQVWRNQLLGESMTRRNHPDSKYEYFTSIILYPEGNDHFRDLVPKYYEFPYSRS